MVETTEEEDGAQHQRKQPNGDNLFFKLPPELRNRIYEFALLQRTPIVIICQQACGQHSRRHAMQPALSRTCRLLRKETLPIFYGQHTFLIAFYPHAPAAEAWLSAIGLENLGLLRNVLIRATAWERKEGMVERGSAYAGPMEKALTICGEKTIGSSKYYRLTVDSVQEEGYGMRMH